MVAWDLGAVAIVTFFGRGKIQIPCHPKCFLEDGCPGLRAFPGAAGEPCSPQGGSSRRTAMTFHCSLTPLRVPVRGETVFKQEK